MSTNNAKFYIDKFGRVEKSENTSFLVTGADNESAINLFITSELDTNIVAYCSFKRADGFAITNRVMELIGLTEDNKYYEFMYIFKKADRVLDIAGNLEVSCTVKVGNKTISTVSNSLYVRHNVKPNLETKTEEEFYQEAIGITENVQKQANELALSKLDKSKTSNIVYGTDYTGEQKEYSVNLVNLGNTIPVRTAEGQVIVSEPTAESHATTKKYVDEKVPVDITKEFNKKVSKTNDPNKIYGTNSTGGESNYNVSLNETPYSIPQRTAEGQINVEDPTKEKHASNKKYVDTAISKAKNDVLETVDKNLIPIEKEIGGKLNSNFLIYTKKSGVDGKENLPIYYNNKNYYIEIKQIIEKIQGEVVNNTNSIVAFAYDTYSDFLDHVQYTEEEGLITLESITNEDSTITYQANQINIGFTILLRESKVPDYWLSKKQVESDSVIDLFTPYETKLKLEDYALKEDLNYTNSMPTTSALGGIPKGTTFDNKPIKEILDDLLYPYVEFSASISTNPNGGTYENGTSQNVSTATVSITLGSKQITSIKVLDYSDNVLAEKTSGITTSNTFTLNKSVTSNTNFKAIVTDGTTSKTVTSGTFTFVNPYYYGSINEGVTLTESLIKGLTKSVSSKGSKTFTITMNQQKAVFAYPSSYGNLTKILDENSFNVTDTFVKNTLTINGVSYYVYVLNTPATSTMKYTFSY